MDAVRGHLIDVHITIGPRAERSSSTIAAVGDYLVVLVTALPSRAVTLTSCYLGGIDGDTAASHLLRVPGDDPPGLGQRILPGGQPAEQHACSCLLDHVAVLRSALAGVAGEPVRIDIDPGALIRAAAAFPTAHNTGL